MSEILTKPYEISVWEDRLVEEDGEYKFEEVKLAVIGSNTMTGLNKVYDPVFHKNSNGEKTLTFSLKYKYFDPYIEQDNIINPFVALLVNERKVKLHYDNEWYEFIIKEHSESNEEFTWTYSCTDAFVLELSKQGYNITFDTELNNNQGTAQELAEETLKDTDWQLGEVNVGRQMIAEPIYLGTLVDASVNIIDTDTGEVPDPSLNSGLAIYVFYSYVANKNGKFVQFIKRNQEAWTVIDSKKVITATNYRIIDELTYDESTKTFKKANGNEVIQINEIETSYQANRLAYAQLNTYDPVMERTVDRYSVNNGDLEVYKYTDYSYTTSSVIVNYMTNGDNFNALEDGTLQGWNPYTDQSNDVPVNPVELTTRPKLATGQKLVDLSVLSQIEGFLQAKFNGPREDYAAVQDPSGNPKGQGWYVYVSGEYQLTNDTSVQSGTTYYTHNRIYNTIYNSGVDNHLSLINSIAKGDKFVFRWRAGKRDSNAAPEIDDLDCLVPCSDLGLVLAKYTSDTPTRFGYYYKHINPADVIATFELSSSGNPTILNNYVKGGKFETVYQLTSDTTVVTGKTYYELNTETGNYDIVTPQTGDNPQQNGWYEYSHNNYVINGVVQEPSTKYIYVISEGDPAVETNYVWNGIEGDYELLANNWSNYLPYYYVVATANKGITNAELKSADKNYGLFLYTTAAVPTSEVTIDEILADSSVTVADLSKTETIEIEPKYNSQIKLYCNGTLITEEEHNYTFIAGTSATITDTDFTYTYNHEKQIITIAVISGREAGIRSYKVEYTEIIPIYIQDIQFTRFIPDEDGVTPVIMGNAPTATSNSTDYYYVQPEEGAQAEDVKLYTNPAALIADYEDFNSITPLYNENSEKYLTITASQSNCFNILQTIAETFECWVELKVEHDDTGKILIDENTGRPRKYVELKEYVGTDNYAGFKYGINLDTIERTVNSDELVTKLIVDQTECEYVDSGFVSIASAPSNTSKESYILNFEYYYGQGLLDKDAAEEDKLKFESDINNINQNLTTLENQRRDLEAALTSLGSNRNVYSDLIASAKDMKNDALEDFKRLTNETYDEYRERHGVLVDGEEINGEEHNITEQVETVILEKYPSKSTTISIAIPFWEQGAQSATCICGIQYEINNSGNLIKYDGDQTFTFTSVSTPSAGAKVSFNYTGTDMKQLTDEQTIYDVLGEIYTSSATINNYSGLLTNVNQEYDVKHKELYGYLDYSVKVWVDTDSDNVRHIYVEFNDYLVGASFKVANDDTEYKVTVSQKRFDISPTNATQITFTLPESPTYHMEPTAVNNQYSINDDVIATYKIRCDESCDGVVDEIAEIRKQKEAIIKAFNNKYSRFIQEGTWNSTDYIDSEKYYLDALQVSNTSAEPVVSYTINVVEISQLEGFEWYNFDVGDKSYIEDTEFFGWQLVGNVPTPIQEEVIVSEVEWHLDEPDQNTITVQNYKTRFEDLFQRVSATVQTVQYNEATYAKISTLMDANGMLNPGVLLSSLNSISGQRYSLTSDGSVVIDGDEILVQDLQNPQNYVIINSNGIEISSDGDVSRRKAVDGRGINVGTVYTGTLNTDNVIIGNENSPSFRWDKSGISAYELPEDSIEAYNLQTFVRFDRFGLYGIKDNVEFTAHNLNEVKNNAHFAVTWDGFFIKNSYEGGGRVEITSDNDFRVLNTVDGAENEKIKIGALEWYDANGNITTDPSKGVGAPKLYGIRMLNNAGEEVMKTGDDGNLTIVGTIEALGANFSKEVTVGKNDDTVSSWIVIDGVNSSIYNKHDEPGRGSDWIIDKNGDAIFNNITARGAIKTAVFEYAEIQAVGGVFLFRPSSTIRSAEKTDWYFKTTDSDIDTGKTYYVYEDPFYIVVDNPVVEDIENYYEKISSLKIRVEKPALFKLHSWCKISNYNNDSIINTTNSGLSYIYEIGDVSLELIDETVVTFLILKGAGEMIPEVVSETELIGGALVDMGVYINGAMSDNYGIGINSSDNYVNLPARAISLFETTINPESTIKVSYNYRGILGTLPSAATANINVDNTIYPYMEGKQGIYTDNMYIGDASQYIAFYRDGNNNGQLKISGDVTIGNSTASEIENNAEYSVMVKTTTIDYSLSTATLIATPYYKNGALPVGVSIDYAWYQDDLNHQIEYVKTPDLEIDVDKTYYIYNGGQYEEVQNPIIADIDDYYEKVADGNTLIVYDLEHTYICVISEL